MITARGGSKGLPRKNILPMAGRPLIGWTIVAALGARCVERVIVSTDNKEIAEVALAQGAEVPFLRPAELASDTAGSIAVLRHAVEQCSGFEYVLLLQPTSPLRTSEDIDSAFARMRELGKPSCVSMCEVEESPWLMYSKLGDGCIAPLMPPLPGAGRRQDMPPVYRINGAIYLAKTAWFLQEDTLLGAETLGYEMPRERSIDIDSRADFDRAEQLLSGSLIA